jgi:hypothetical protein
MTKLAYTRDGTEYAIDQVSDPSDALELLAECFEIPAKSVEYLLIYGLKQSLQDSAAQPASEAKASGDDVMTAVHAAMAKRLDAIKSGTVGVRVGGGRVSDPFESAVRDVIDEMLRKAAKSKGKKLPKGDELVALRAKVREANKSVVESEARRRVESTIEIEL